MLSEELCICPCQCQRKQEPFPGSPGYSEYNVRKMLHHFEQNELFEIGNQMCNECRQRYHFNNESLLNSESSLNTETSVNNEDPLKTLRIRLSKGEISIEEFDEIKKRIEE